ncbi:MAG: hypothetical protein ACLGIJ_03705 [Candidatus Limnocylindria bacterium]
MQFRPLLLTTAAAIVFTACSGGGATTAPSVAPSVAPSSAPAATATPDAPSMAPAPMTDGAAADLRTALNLKLGEHIILAAKVTGAALDGRSDEFAAYGGLLNANGTDLGAMIGSVYGDAAKDEFNRIWSAHNGFFVDYTTGVATNDMAMQDKAVQDLTTVYVPEFSTLIAGATGLPQDAVEGLVTDHVVQTKAIVDAQAGKDFEGAYAALRTAFGHMQMIGDALATAIVGQNAATFDGEVDSPAVSFRVALNQLLQEHLFIASATTGAALDGRSEEFAAAGAVLNTNGTDLGAAIGSLYGDAAKDEFNRIWSAHNGFFVDYTTGVATNDQAVKDKAVQDLTTVYLPEFSAFIAGATDLPLDAVTALVEDHILTTAAIVDAQAGGDWEAAAAADRSAAEHMQMIGDPLAAAIVAKFPDAFAN